MALDDIAHAAPFGLPGTGSPADGRRATACSVRLAALAVAALCLASCVVSETPLVKDAKPTLGSRFTVQLFRKFSDGRAHELNTSVFEWKGDTYVNTGGSAMDLPQFVARPLSNDYIIQSSNVGRKLFTYWIGRKVTDGVYLVIPLDEGDLSGGLQDTLCRKGSPVGFCVIETAGQLDDIARVTAKSPLKNAEVAVIVEQGLKAGADLKSLSHRSGL